MKTYKSEETLKKEKEVPCCREKKKRSVLAKRTDVRSARNEG